MSSKTHSYVIPGLTRDPVNYIITDPNVIAEMIWISAFAGMTRIRNGMDKKQ